MGAINSHATALRFFLRFTLGRSSDAERVPVMREQRRLPIVLTREEVARIIAAASGLKYRTALSVTHGAGLCASETVKAILSCRTAALPHGGATSSNRHNRARRPHVRH